MSAPDPGPYPPDSAEATCVLLAALNDKSLEALRADVAGSQAFSVSEARALELATRIGLSRTNSASALEVLGLLYSWLHGQIDNPPPEHERQKTLIGEIAELLAEFDFKGSEEVSKISTRLAPLLARTPKGDLWVKRRRLMRGFLPNVIGLASFLDLRPSYDDALQEIVEFVPMVQLRVTTDAATARERHFVCQLDAQAISKLKEALERIEKKIATLDRVPIVARPIARS